MTRPFLYVSNADVRKLLTPADAVRIARDVLVEHAHGAVDWAEPRQTNLVVRDSPTRFKVKGCVLHETGVAGFRVLSLNRTEDGYALAAHRPTKNVLLSDPQTGEFYAIVDERWGYGLRTGACGAVAVGALRTPDSTDAAILGTGHMAHAAALTLNEVMPLRTLRVYSRTPEKRRAFADRLRDELGCDVTAPDDVEHTVRDAPVVITATEAREPIVEHGWLAPGVVVYAMGGYQELDTTSYDRMRLVVDDREQVAICDEFVRWSRNGDPWPDIEADLGEVVTGAAGTRTSATEQFLVRSQGLVTQDVGQARWLYDQARAHGLGTELESALVEQPEDALF